LKAVDVTCYYVATHTFILFFFGHLFGLHDVGIHPQAASGRRQRALSRLGRYLPRKRIVGLRLMRLLVFVRTPAVFFLLLAVQTLLFLVAVIVRMAAALQVVVPEGDIAAAAAAAAVAVTPLPWDH